jgi:hypothetical protein
MALRERVPVNGRGLRARRWPAAAALVAASWLALSPSGVPAAAPAGAAHRGWDDLVRRHVRGDRVDYDGFQRDRARLRGYLESLREPVPGLGRNDEIALWINAYNAATIDLIVRERMARRERLRSIKDIPAPWTRPRWRIGGAERTLDEIEHEILRKRFHEPRIHFALVCASRSCPALRPAAYRGAFLDAQLDSAAREFVRDTSRNQFEPVQGRIRISKIFDWYANDFARAPHDETVARRYGREHGAVLAFVERFLDPADVARLRSSNARVEFLPYDWSLNSAGNAR